MLFRVYIDHPADLLEISGDDFIYLVKVPRLQIGGKFEVVSGSAEIKIFEISILAKHSLKAKFIDSYQEDNEKNRSLIIAQALPKGDKLDLILQKCTEIGVKAFYFYESAKSPVKISKTDKKFERWQKIIKAAVCQSRRNYLPEIKFFKNLTEVLAEEQKIYYADIDPLAKQLGMISDERLMVIIGPESGFSDKEREVLAGKAAKISLGNSVLRTETAAIAAAARLLI
jgi:16S rRNA (uracil1498-N3)-methyltransferase